MAQWLTLCTKPKMERQVINLLQSRGIEGYLPLLQQFSAHRRRLEPVPFFPCYLFATVDPNSTDLVSVSWLPGLRYVVRFDDRPAWVSDQVIQEVRNQLTRRERSGGAGQSKFKPGDRVRITTGPLKDLEAVFDRNVSKDNRVRILLEFLRQLTACEVRLDWIERAASTSSASVAESISIPRES
jgi:transcriptional antiterminator RfaH